MTNKPAFIYVIYIQSTPERVWQALTDAELTARYWGQQQRIRTGRPDRAGSTSALTGPVLPTWSAR